MNCNVIKIHMNKAKDEMLDQLDKEICVVRKMVEDKIGQRESCTVEEISNLYFDNTGVVCKYFAQREVPYLSDYDTFTKFIGTYFLLARTSSSATDVLLNKESITFYTIFGS